MTGVEYLLEALTPFHIMLALVGVIAGTIVGSLPGLTIESAILLLPASGIVPNCFLAATGN